MRYLFGIFVIVIVLITIIVLLFNRDPSPDAPDRSRQIELTEYADTAAKTVYETEGEINAEEEHHIIRISVDRNLRRVEVLRGYNGTIEKAQEFSNTQSAYDEFLHALKNAGYTNEQNTPFDSEKGVCPLGRRHIYKVTEFGDNLVRLWSTSCSKGSGSFAGDARLVEKLFQNQIPEYRDFVRDVKL